MRLILRSFLMALVCLMGSTVFAEQRTNKVKIYIPQKAISMKAGKIIVGKGSGSFRIKAIQSDRHGFYIYENDALLQKLIAKGYVYGCSKCSEEFHDYYEATKHVLMRHSNAKIYIKRKE
jgi:hypothetical protein